MKKFKKIKQYLISHKFNVSEDADADISDIEQKVDNHAKKINLKH